MFSFVCILGALFVSIEKLDSLQEETWSKPEYWTKLIYFVNTRFGNLDPIFYILINLKVEDIAVLDPTFNSGPEYKSVLARFIAHGFLGRLSLQCRFEMVDNDFLGKFTFKLFNLHFFLMFLLY